MRLGPCVLFQTLKLLLVKIFLINGVSLYSTMLFVWFFKSVLIQFLPNFLASKVFVTPWTQAHTHVHTHEQWFFGLPVMMHFFACVYWLFVFLPLPIAWLNNLNNFFYQIACLFLINVSFACLWLLTQFGSNIFPRYHPWPCWAVPATPQSKALMYSVLFIFSFVNLGFLFGLGEKTAHLLKACTNGTLGFFFNIF